MWGSDWIKGILAGSCSVNNTKPRRGKDQGHGRPRGDMDVQEETRGKVVEAAGGDQGTDVPQIHERQEDKGEDRERNRRVGGKVITGMRGGTVGGKDRHERERERERVRGCRQWMGSLHMIAVHHSK